MYFYGDFKRNLLVSCSEIDEETKMGEVRQLTILV